MAWHCRPLAFCWSWLKPLFRPYQPPSPVSMQRRKVRYSMRADFPGALPRTPAPPNAMSPFATALFSPSTAPKDLFRASEQTLPIPSPISRPPALPKPAKPSTGPVSQPQPGPSTRRVVSQPIRKAVQKKEADDAANRKPSDKVLGKRKVSAPSKTQTEGTKIKRARAAEPNETTKTIEPELEPGFVGGGFVSMNQPRVQRKAEPRRSPARKATSVKTGAPQRVSRILKNDHQRDPKTTSEDDSVKPSNNNSRVSITKRKASTTSLADQAVLGRKTVDGSDAGPPRKRRVASRVVLPPQLESPPSAQME